MNENMNKKMNENIQQIVKSAIDRKQKEIQRITNEYNTLKKQQSSGVYYMPIDMNENSASPLKYFAISLVTLLGEVLKGFRDAAENIKTQTTNIENVEKKQSGGKLNHNRNKDAKQIKSFANIVIKTIDKTNKSIEANIKKLNKQKGGNDGVSTDTEGAGKEVLDKIGDLGEVGLKTGIKFSADAISKVIDWGMELSGEENILETPFSELSAGLNKKLLIAAGTMREMSTNPIAKEAIRELAEAIGVTIIEIMEQIKPEVDKVADQSVLLVEGVADKFTKGTANTAISVVQAFLAEIPWVGGIIDLFIAIGKGFNTLMGTYAIFMEKTDPMILTTAQGIKNTEDKVVEGKNRIEGAVNNAKDKINQISNMTDPTNISAPNISAPNISAPNISAPSIKRGGSYTLTDDNIQRMIQKGGKRLRKTIKLFNNTLPKTKFRFDNKPCYKTKKNRTKKRRT